MTEISARRARVEAMNQWLENFVVSAHGPLAEAQTRQVEEALRELEDSLQRLRNHDVHRAEHVTTNYDAILRQYFEDVETRRKCVAAEASAAFEPFLVDAIYDPEFVTTERFTVESVGRRLATQIPDYLYWALAAVLPALWSFWTDADELDRLRDLIRSFTKHVDHLVEQVLKSLGAPQRIHEFLSKHRVFHLIHGAHPPDVSPSLSFSFSA